MPENMIDEIIDAVEEARSVLCFLKRVGVSLATKAGGDDCGYGADSVYQFAHERLQAAENKLYDLSAMMEGSVLLKVQTSHNVA